MSEPSEGIDGDADKQEKPSTTQESTFDLALLRKTVSQVYIEAKKAGDKVDPSTSVYPIFDQAIEKQQTDIDLWIEYLVTLERNKEPLEKIVEIFDKSLYVPFSKGESFLNLWLTYLDFLRRHTDWCDETQVASVDKAFDACSQYLGRIQNSDPELKVLKYWAFLRAKYLQDIKGARGIWDDISKQQGLKYAKTAKFWLEYAEFERKFGENNLDHYRQLLYKALKQTDDFPDIIGERLIQFERQEGDTVELVLEAQRRLSQALDYKRKGTQKNQKRKKEQHNQEQSSHKKVKTTSTPATFIPRSLLNKKKG